MLNTKTWFPYLSQWPWTCRSQCRQHCWPCIGNPLHQSLRLCWSPDRLSHQQMWSWCVHLTSAPSCPSSIGWSGEETRWRDIWGLASHPQLWSLAPVGHRILVAGSFLQERWERSRIATEVFEHQQNHSEGKLTNKSLWYWSWKTSSLSYLKLPHLSWHKLNTTRGVNPRIVNIYSLPPGVKVFSCYLTQIKSLNGSV